MIMTENIVKQFQKFIHNTEQNWLDAKCSMFFAKDFDLYWAYEYFKSSKDYDSLSRMFDEHGLRVARQSGKSVNEVYLLHLYEHCTLLGTLEIKLPVEGGFDWTEVNY